MEVHHQTHTLICLLWSQGLQFSKQVPTFQETYIDAIIETTKIGLKFI